MIAGFPGETDEEFEETHAFMEHSPLTYFHVFSYSDRPGTAASAMSPKVRPEIIHARSLLLRELGERKNAAFQERLSGSEQRALVLRERADDGRLVGLTGNYVEVLVTGDDSLMNRFVRVQLERFLPDGRWETPWSAWKRPPDAGRRPTGHVRLGRGRWTDGGRRWMAAC